MLGLGCADDADDAARATRIALRATELRPHNTAMQGYGKGFGGKGGGGKGGAMRGGRGGSRQRWRA